MRRGRVGRDPPGHREPDKKPESDPQHSSYRYWPAVKVRVLRMISLQCVGQKSVATALVEKAGFSRPSFLGGDFLLILEQRGGFGYLCEQARAVNEHSARIVAIFFDNLTHNDMMDCAGIVNCEAAHR